MEKIFNIWDKKAGSVIVVDISSNLKLLNVKFKGEIKVTALKIVKLPADKKEEVILNSLRDFIQENKILHKNAILKPHLDSLLIKRIQLPAIPEAELLEAIKWQIKEELTFDLAQAQIDFSILKETTKEDGAKVLDVMCVVAREQEIKQQVLLLKQAGLNCLAVIPLVFGYTKLAAKYLLPSKDEAISILHLDEEICFLSIHKDNKLEFYREIPLSINKLRESLKGTLVSDKGRVELSTDEVEEVLFNLGVPQKEVVYKDKFNTVQILSMLRPTLERLAVEIRRSLNYYISQFQGVTVNKILVTGLAVEIPHIDKFLSQEMSLNIEKISLADKAIASPNIDLKALSQSYASFGLALDYEQGINLLPHEFRTQNFEKFQKVSLRWIAFIAFLLLIFSYFFARIGVTAYQKRLDNAKLHLNVLSEVKQIKTRIDEFNKFITEIKNSQASIDIMLKKLSVIAARDLFIDNLSLDCDSKIGSIMGLVKSIHRNPDAILTQFATDIQNSKYFSEVSISSAEKSRSENTNIVKFKLNFKLP